MNTTAPLERLRGHTTHLRQKNGIHRRIVLEVLQNSHALDLARPTVNVQFA